MRKASAGTDQIGRSLLQKAVRRGCPEVADAAFSLLTRTKEEINWIRSRITVFVFEEAWPYGEQITFGKSEHEIRRHLDALCISTKNKDAAGLGALAYALSTGDTSVLDGDGDNWAIRVVAKALSDKDKFREWAMTESQRLSKENAQVVMKAIEGSKKAGWPWDKAFAYSAALLAIKGPIPELGQAVPTALTDFPFWIAIDKHTTQGKEAIRKAAKEVGFPSNTALWLSFYFESAVCNKLIPSPWWDRERRWRLHKLGLSDDEAIRQWQILQPVIRESLRTQADDLARRIAEIQPSPLPSAPIQPELL